MTRRVILGLAATAVVVLAIVGGAYAWAVFGGGGPLLWTGAIRPAYIDPTWEQTSPNTFCSPPGGDDRMCVSVMGPWTHDPAEAYGGDRAEYARIAALTGCDELQVYVEQTEADLRAGGPLTDRGHQPEEGYIIAAGLRQRELHCYD